MGIDDFKTGNRRTYTEGSRQAGQQLKSKEQVKNILSDMRDNIGHFPSYDEWDDNKSEYNITTAASDIGDVVGETLREIENDMGYKHKDTYLGNAKRLLSDINYNDDADGYTYVLKLERDIDGKIFWYVGCTLDIVNRIFDHLKNDGDFHGPKKDNGDIIKSKDVCFHLISIKDVCSYNFDTQEVMSGLKVKERKRYIDLVLDKKSHNILGR